MKPLEPLRFSHPLRDVQLVPDLVPQDWTEQLAMAERAGYDRGVIDGEKTLGEQLVRQRNEVLALHSGAVEALQQAVPKVMRDCEDALISLAFEVAAKLAAELPISREMMAGAVREAMAEVQSATEFRVEMNPEDLALLHEHSAAALFPGRQVLLMPSPAVRRGGCVVHTKFGTVDARRETRLRKVAEALELPA